MSAASPSRYLALALFCMLLVGTSALARAEQPPVAGGTVPSVLSLSLGEPSRFTRVGTDSAGRGIYRATIRAEVTATEAPLRLDLVSGEVDTALRFWGQPVANAQAKIHLRRVARNARQLRNRQELLLVTLTAGGP